MRKAPVVPGGIRLTPKTGRPSKALKGLAVHTCQHPGCGKTYTRKEHLLRHERTHRNELPYVCPDCGQGYARQDLLKRHSSLKHGHPPLSYPEASSSTPLQPALAPLPDISQPASVIDPRLAENPFAADHHVHPGPPPYTPQRQLSITSHTMQEFSQLGLSSNNASAQMAAVRAIPPPVSQYRAAPPVTRELPVPWGARVYPQAQVSPDVNLLRAAAYGDLTEIRKLHLAGVNVLATGNFESGTSKSALHAAAESIKTGFEDLSKANDSTRDRVWQRITSNTEVVKYLAFHGGKIEELEAPLQAAFHKALKGPSGMEVHERRTQTQAGYRPIVAANVDVRLPPIGNCGPLDKARRGSMNTSPLDRIKVEADEKQHLASPKGKGRAG